MDAPGRVSWSPSPSKNNKELETALKRIAKLASREQGKFYVACTDLDGKFRASLSSVGASDYFVKVEAGSELQSLFQAGAEACQKGLDHPHDGLPLEDIMDYESDLIECAKTVYMTEGPFSLKTIDRLSPLTFGGASLLNGDKVIIEVVSDDKKECLFKLFKKLFEDGLPPPTEGLE